MPSFSRSCKILLPSSFPPSGATSTVCVTGNCASTDRSYHFCKTSFLGYPGDYGLTILALPPRAFSTAYARIALDGSGWCGT